MTIGKCSILISPKHLVNSINASIFRYTFKTVSVDIFEYVKPQGQAVSIAPNYNPKLNSLQLLYIQPVTISFVFGSRNTTFCAKPNDTRQTSFTSVYVFRLIESSIF